MENILIVCADKILRHDIIRVLSKELGFLYADIDEVLDYEILNHASIALADAGNRLNELEQLSIARTLEFKNCVIGVSTELFVSNDNFELFQMPRVYITLSKAHLIARSKWDTNKLEQELLLFDKIDLLIRQNCHIIIDKGIKSIEEITSDIVKGLSK